MMTDCASLGVDLSLNGRQVSMYIDHSQVVLRDKTECMLDINFSKKGIVCNHLVTEKKTVALR